MFHMYIVYLYEYHLWNIHFERSINGKLGTLVSGYNIHNDRGCV